ncbi:MAG: type III toxin-antitoxin system CptIN family toxin [Roseburia faecis]
MFVATRYATQTRSSSNVCRYSICDLEKVEFKCFEVPFEKYFKDFPDPYLMQNKEKVNGQLHDRPCFYAFQDSNTQLFWMIPFSSQVSKFKGIYNKKMQKYHRCDTIVFGEVLGHEKAFLIQNMCPITEKYMKNEYLDSAANIPVRVDGRLEKELKDKAGKVLALQRKGAKLIFPDVLSIEQELL